MLTIALDISGDTPGAVALTALTRSDTGGTVAGVTLPADFTESGGQWVFSFDEPSEGLTYDYAYRITWSDGTTTDGSDTITGSAATTTYATRADVEDLYGRDNVAAWADLNDNADAAEIAARVERARQAAYRWVNSKLRAAGLTAPATADDFSEHDLLADVEAERAGAWLYFSRGKDQQQGADGADGAMQWHWDHAEKELDRIIGVAAATDDDDATAPPGTFQSVTINRRTSCAGDEYSSY